VFQCHQQPRGKADEGSPLFPIVAKVPPAVVETGGAVGVETGALVAVIGGAVGIETGAFVVVATGGAVAVETGD